jgi:hypothetical protein
MARVTVTLETDEMLALRRSADRDRRDPRAQAAYLIREGLKAHGALRDVENAPPVWPDDDATGTTCQSQEGRDD